MEKTNRSVITRTVAGSLIGAAVGYIATPENGKKLKKNLRADKLKSAGTGLGKSVKDKSVQAIETLKNSTGKIFNKKEDIAIDGYSNESEDSVGNETGLSTGIENEPENNNEQTDDIDTQVDTANEENHKLEQQSGQEKSGTEKDHESLQEEQDKLQDRLDNIEKLLTKVLQETSSNKTASQAQNEVLDNEVEETYLK